MIKFRGTTSPLFEVLDDVASNLFLNFKKENKTKKTKDKRI